MLAKEYRNQYKLRDWATVFERLPIIPGANILDLGCSIGDQSAAMTGFGANVVGIDRNPELLEIAEQRKLVNCQFTLGDLTDLPLRPSENFDGLWSSFAPAYFPMFLPVLTHWIDHLKPGGWVALHEVTDMFSRAPLEGKYIEKIEDFYNNSFRMNRYDYRMGSKLATYLQQAGLRNITSSDHRDLELSTDGALTKDAIQSWQRRFGRMKNLQAHFGDEFEGFQRAFIQCLSIL